MWRRANFAHAVTRFSIVCRADAGHSARDALGRVGAACDSVYADLFECHAADRKGLPVTISRLRNSGAVSRRVCNQIALKTTPDYWKLFNEFYPLDLRLTFAAERAGERKLRGRKANQAWGRREKRWWRDPIRGER